MPGARMEISGRSPLRDRRWCLLIAIGCFFVSRYIYYRMGVRFDAEPLQFYWQIIDPALLRHELWQSLLYLRTQPPGLNLYIGAVLHLFPGHSTAAFEATGLGLGLVLTICMFLLLERMGMSRPLALPVTIVCMVNPVTALYENWLFYEYPIAVLFCVSALFLHRYASSHRRMDGIVFFSSLCLLGLLRVFYNVLWFALLAALVAYVLPGWRRRTVLCAVGPGVVLLATALKSLILFGLWIPGSDVQGATNLGFIATGNLPIATLDGMAAAGTISPVLSRFRNPLEDASLVDLVPMPPKTGISILDARLKSTGRISMDSLWMAAYARQLRQDSLTALRAHPEVILTAVNANLERYFLPADIGWPFDAREHPPNRVLSRSLKVFDLILTGKHPAHRYAYISRVAIPILLLFGLVRSGGWLMRIIRHPEGNAGNLTISFAFGNIVYLTAVVILLSCGDQNRYAFEIFPLYTILLGSLTTSFVAWIRSGGRRFVRKLPPGHPF
jgi:hypothetical protein